MQERTVQIKMPHGVMDTFIAHPDGAGPFASVVMYQNIGGVGDTMRLMARRVAAEGYYCAIPDLYYRLGKIVIDPDSNDEHVLALRKVVSGSLRNAAVMEDTRVLLDFMAGEPMLCSNPKGVIGYCMGGRFALLASGHFANEFRATASLFGVGLITEAPDSPHLVLDKIRGEIYCGFAEHDRVVPPALVDRFSELLKGCTAKSLVETHPGTHHGYAFPGRAVYHEKASEKSWERIFAMFRRQLALVK